MSLVAEDTRTAVEPWRDDAVSTPEGAGVYLGVTQTDLGITYRVELAHGGGTRYYRLDEITVLPRNRAPKGALTYAWLRKFREPWLDEAECWTAAERSHARRVLAKLAALA